MFDHLLPRRVDNDYRGHKLALWLLALLLFMKGAIALNSIFNGHTVAMSADGIPLDTFTPAGARAVVSLFALLGFSQLVFCLLGIFVLVRYRGLVPFLFALLLLEYLGKRLILQFLPLVQTAAPPGTIVSFVSLALMVAGLALSLWGRAVLSRAV